MQHSGDFMYTALKRHMHGALKWFMVYDFDKTLHI